MAAQRVSREESGAAHFQTENIAFQEPGCVLAQFDLERKDLPALQRFCAGMGMNRLSWRGKGRIEFPMGGALPALAHISRVNPKLPSNSIS